VLYDHHIKATKENLWNKKIKKKKKKKKKKKMMINDVVVR
jgi:hypothetical protein